MEDPVAMYFPPDTLDDIRKAIETHKKTNPDYAGNPLWWLYTYTKYYEDDVRYGFLDYLVHDFYAPTQKEREKLHIDMFNCTTVIPRFYQLFEGYGLQPEIVQFLGFRSIRRKKDEEEPIENEHFALLVRLEKHGKVKEYLADPFQEVFGEIIEKGDYCWKLRGYRKYKAARREFQKVLYYTKEEYAQMLYDLREDGKSLDMLVAGQKVRNEHTVAKVNCSLMVYYDDETNALTTRLYIPQIGITDKAIHCAQYLDGQGTVQKHELTLSLAKNHTWHYLVGERCVAVTDFSTLQKIKQLLGRKVNLRKQPRIGQLLAGEEMGEEKKKLTEIAEDLYSKLSPEQQQAILPLVFVRTLYEAEAIEQDYIYNEEDRDAKIKEMLRQEVVYRNEMQAINDLLLFNHWKFSSLQTNERRRLKRKKTSLEQKRDDLQFDALNRLRRNNKPVYHRTMDKVLFAQQYEHTPVEELAQIVEERRLDWRNGYLAMVTEFIPYALEGCGTEFR